MYETRAVEATDHGGKLQLPYAEMDPSQRYERFKDVLGKGAMKTVYRAFDEFLGMEVAWNQVKLNVIFGSPEEMNRLYSEVHLLKNLNHSSIMKSRASWIDVDRRTFNFITEMLTSGTLREYLKRYTRVNVRAIKYWARQILEGLDYLHSHDPPVIHRDLKCDNIFVNGHLGEVKIGDLGLAAILRESHHAHSVIGTPEFMAPELYEEDYDELVDVYSFGMCVLEMLTSEYPYNECSNPAQIYKKVTLGKLPQAFFKIDDAEARRFVGRCLVKAPTRPSARELLMDPFLVIEEAEELPAITISSPKAAAQSERSQKDLMPQLGVRLRNTDMIITGTMNSEDDAIFLRVHVSDKDGRARNIYFPFDIASDTPLDVATEMVKELEIPDWEPFEIADMIDEEISSLIPSWKNPISPQINQQHSFNYCDENYDNDDNSPHHPFYFESSFASSQDSLPGLPSFNEAEFCNCGWLQEESEDHDDASSDISSLTRVYSNLKYCSANEDDTLPSSPRDNQHCNSRTKKSTRFCPEVDTDKNKQKMVRAGSLVDVRSQLLHRTLVEEINKRRLFNTVGVVENIGFCDPTIGEMMRGVSQGQSGRRNGRRSCNRV